MMRSIMNLLLVFPTCHGLEVYLLSLSRFERYPVLVFAFLCPCDSVKLAFSRVRTTPGARRSLASYVTT